MSEIKSSRSCGNFLAQPAFELFRRRAKREIGLRANQVDDCFGLRQVEFAVEKSALGEFTRHAPPARPRAGRSPRLVPSPARRHGN